MSKIQLTEGKIMFFLFINAGAVDPRVLEYAAQVSPLARIAIRAEEDWSKTNVADLNNLREAIQAAQPDAQAVKTQLKTDWGVYSQFVNDRVKYKEENGIGFDALLCKVKKMPGMLEQALGLNIEQILSCTEKFVQDHPTVSGEDLCGSASTTIMRTVMYAALKTIDPCHPLLANSPFLYKKQGENIAPCTYDFGGAVGIAHNGYMFSARRTEADFMQPGPEDCSSWVQKLLGIRGTFITRTLWNWQQDRKVESSATGLENFEHVDKYLNPERLEPGLIALQGGHMGIFMGMNPHNPAEYIMLSYNRDDDWKRDGLGYEFRPIEEWEFFKWNGVIPE